VVKILKHVATLQLVDNNIKDDKPGEVDVLFCICHKRLSEGDAAYIVMCDDDGDHTHMVACEECIKASGIKIKEF
jgi:hypothetical protein